MKNKTEVKSPCIGHCCLDQKDICLGCFRSIDEILVWGSASATKQKEIIELTLQRKQERK
ncbi:MAG: putative Fe-S protein YdhL (DUF1289 family) [Alphaproteobacteria bacterium]|jgi:predicted Fe-S protein YdhL (DUF1289 family)